MKLFLKSKSTSQLHDYKITDANLSFTEVRAKQNTFFLDIYNKGYPSNYLSHEKYAPLIEQIFRNVHCERIIPSDLN